jgi:hypothetical protein
MLLTLSSDECSSPISQSASNRLVPLPLVLHQPPDPYQPLLNNPPTITLPSVTLPRILGSLRLEARPIIRCSAKRARERRCPIARDCSFGCGGEVAELQNGILEVTPYSTEREDVWDVGEAREALADG